MGVTIGSGVGRSGIGNGMPRGGETRTIVSGIKKSYSPGELVGKKIILFANLKPAKLAGIESDGMLLAAADEEGGISILVPDKDVPEGSEVS